jgi:hypothetical protein
MSITAPWPSSIVALISGELTTWRQLAMAPGEFLDHCTRHELLGLVHARIDQRADREDWPAAVRDELARYAREETARELLRREEIAGVIATLAEVGVRAVVLKGAALAYTVYDNPVERPRLDTDLFVDARDVAAVRAALERRGYAAPPYCADLFSQLEMTMTDRFGLVHVIDVHWRISTQAVFADVLAFDEVASRCVPLPSLGAAAVALCRVDALLLACIHPVMHHQNEQRLHWIYDIHLLAEQMTEAEFEEFARLARAKHMAAVCAHGVRLAQTAFSARLPSGILASLDRGAAAEPSAEYLASERRWHHETLASLRALPRFADRARLVREVLLPSPQYMLGAYGLRGKPLGAWLLPALYVHRNVRGAWKIIAGKK